MSPALAQTTTWTGSVSNDYSTVGNWNPAAAPTAQGNLAIDNGDSVQAATELRLGDTGAGSLTISNGSSLTNQAGVVLGRQPGGNGTVNVQGTNSVWSVGGDLYVGSISTGTVSIDNGGSLTSQAATYIGNRAGSTGTVTVSGSGSSWTTQGDLTVGNNGTASLTIDQGAVFTSNAAVTVGRGATGTGDLTVDGVGSAWTVGGVLSVGNSSTGTLTVSGGGALTTTGVAYLGNVAGSSGTATLTGAGSNWTAQDDLTVGYNGTGTLTVIQGATLTNDADVLLGRGATGTGDLTVDGAGSAWTVGGVLSVGNAGTGTLTVANGGALTTNGLTYLGNVAGSSGTATLTGPGSSWTTQDTLTLGARGTGILTVNQGATLTSSADATLGHGVTGTGGVTVDGAGSAWTVGGILSVGNSGLGTLTVGNGGTLTTSDVAYLGNVAGSSGTAILNDLGSSWTAQGVLTVGNNGNGALVVTQGATVASSTDVFVGRGATGTGNVIVSGAGSAWTVGGILSVGNSGTGTLMFNNGATLTTAGVAYLGNVAGSSGTATLTGAGSSWTTQNDLTIGYNGTGTLRVDLGATLTSNAGAIVGRGATGTGGATVDGIGSAWNVAGLLSVGNAGIGTLTVSNGGVVTTGGDAYLGNVVGGQGTASVDGAGSSWSVEENFYVGGNYLDVAGIGAVSVTDGALLSIGGQMTIYSTGTVTIDQSTLSVQSVDNRGSLVLQDMQLNAPLTLGETAETSVLGTVDFLNSVTGGGNFTGTGEAVFHNLYKPADGVATPSFAGDVTFAAGSTFQVDIAPNGTSDRIDVTGKATLSGGTVAITAGSGPYVPSTVYTIVTAGAGLDDTVFAGLTSDFAFLVPELGYGTNSVTLTFDKIPFSSAALTANQVSVATALEGLGSGDPLFDAVLTQTFDGARQAFDAVSGEAHAFAPATAYTGARLVQGSLLNRLRRTPPPAASLAERSLVSLRPVAVAPTTFDPHKAAVWGEGFGSWGTVDADGNAAGLDSTTGGFVIGADTALDETYRIGVAGGFTRTTFNADGRQSSGSNESVFGALYGSAAWGGLNLRLGTSLAAHDIEVERTVVFPGFADRTEASYNGWTAQAFGEIGYRADIGPAVLEPFAGASFLHLHMDDFVEEGGAAALTGYARDHHFGTTTLGLRAEAQVSADMPLVVRGMAGWRHAYGDVAPTSVQAFGNGASAFTVSSVPGDRDALVAEAGLDWQPSADITVGVAYQGQVGSKAEDHAVKGSFRWKF